MRVRKLEDRSGRPNSVRFIYGTDGLVHIEVTAKHAGDTVVTSAVTVPRVLFADAIKELGVL